MFRLFLPLLLFSVSVRAQSLETLRMLAAQNQKCLDSGVHMQECSRNYYFQMDSILNMAYNNLQAKLPPSQRDALKKEQKAWLQKRDKYFAAQQKEFDKNMKSGEWGPDMFMVVYQRDADFIEKRNEALIKRLTHAGK